MALNKRKTSVTAPSHKNFEGGTSFDINDPFTRLQVAATSCFFGEPAFYIDGDSAPKKGDVGYGWNHYGRYAGISDAFGGELVSNDQWQGMNTRELLESAIDAALDVDVERTLKFAVELRNEWLIRSTPQVIMVRAARHPNVANTGLIGVYANRIMTRLDEVMNQMAYFESVQGNLKRIPSRLKRAWAARLEQASEYEIAKYKLSSRSVNVFDAVRLTHANSEVIDKLIEGNVSLSNENTQTWESVRSGGGSWNEAVQKMGHMALLRNLRNLNTDGEINNEILSRLIGGVEKGKQLPFRYWSALEAVGRDNARMVDALDECFEKSIGFTVPRFTGKTLAIADVSGSMDASLSDRGTMQFSTISRLMAIVTAKASRDGGDVMLFGTNNKKFSIRQKSSSFDEMERLRGNHGCGHGTNVTGVFKTMIKDAVSYDTVFLYSDMQCGYESTVPKLLAEYRRKVNPNVQVFFVNLAGYQDSLVPEFYRGTYMIGGWSDKVLQFADKIIGITE